MARTLFALMVLLSVVVGCRGLGFSESAPMMAVGPAKTRPMGHHLPLTKKPLR